MLRRFTTLQQNFSILPRRLAPHIMTKINEWKQKRLERALLKKHQKDYNRKCHKIFVKENFAHIIFLDIIFFIMIASNLGAFLITEHLVLKDLMQENPESVAFVESNPITAETNGYKTDAQSNKFFFQLFSWLAKWGFIAVFYFMLRLRIRDWDTYENLATPLIWCVVILSFDFLSNMVLFLTYHKVI